MADLLVKPSSLRGSLTVPPSKSHTQRAILFAALARGRSIIENFLPSPDATAMIMAVSQLGAEISLDSNGLEIEGCRGQLKEPKAAIDCGNSGQVLRFVGALAGLLPHPTLLTGDASLCRNRPVKPLIDGLNQLGAAAICLNQDDHAPLLIQGPLKEKTASIDGRDSQPISGLLIASSLAPHPIDLYVTDPGERPWVELTLQWFNRLGISYQRCDFGYFHLEGNSSIEAFSTLIPGDFSSALFSIMAALITHSELTLTHLDNNDCQGDKAVIPLLVQMGASIDIDEKNGSLHVKGKNRLRGRIIDVNDFIDALPLLTVLACFCEEPTEIKNGAIARKKESDRIHAITLELRKMGALIEETEQGMFITPSPLYGTSLYSHHDHRIAMALTVAALGAEGDSMISSIDCIDKSYPSFIPDFQNCGAQLELLS